MAGKVLLVSDEIAFSVEFNLWELWVGIRWEKDTTLYWHGTPWSCWLVEYQIIPGVKMAWWGPNFRLT